MPVLEESDQNLQYLRKKLISLFFQQIYPKIGLFDLFQRFGFFSTAHGQSWLIYFFRTWRPN